MSFAADRVAVFDSLNVNYAWKALALLCASHTVLAPFVQRQFGG